MIDLIDHQLPLVALKEQRRDLVSTLLGHRGPLPDDVIFKIASIQTAINAIEAVICDLDEDFACHSTKHDFRLAS